MTENDAEMSLERAIEVFPEIEKRYFAKLEEHQIEERQFSTLERSYEYARDIVKVFWDRAKHDPMNLTFEELIALERTSTERFRACIFARKAIQDGFPFDKVPRYARVLVGTAGGQKMLLNAIKEEPFFNATLMFYALAVEDNISYVDLYRFNDCVRFVDDYCFKGADCPGNPRHIDYRDTRALAQDKLIDICNTGKRIVILDFNAFEDRLLWRLSYTLSAYNAVKQFVAKNPCQTRD